MEFPTLILQLKNSVSFEILKHFILGESLSTEQLYLLQSHKHHLNEHNFDLLYDYYIGASKKRKLHTSFLHTTEILTKESLRKFKERLKIFLQKTSDCLVLNFTQEQLLNFQKLNSKELIFFFDNQAPTGASKFAGRIPPVIHFQWENFFGVIKPVILNSEKPFIGNRHIYFENRRNRSLEKCVSDYQNQFNRELKHKNNILVNNNMLTRNKIFSSLFDNFILKGPALIPQPK